MTPAKHQRRARARPSNPLQRDFFAELDINMPPDIHLVPVPKRADALPGTLDDDQRVRQALSAAIRQSVHDREAIARHMSVLTGRTVSRPMIDAWTGPSRENRFALRDLRAFVTATGGDPGWLLQGLCEGTGYAVLSSQEAEMARLGQLCLLARLADQEIAQTIRRMPRLGGAA